MSDHVLNRLALVKLDQAREAAAAQTVFDTVRAYPPCGSCRHIYPGHTPTCPTRLKEMEASQ